MIHTQKHTHLGNESIFHYNAYWVTEGERLLHQIKEIKEIISLPFSLISDLCISHFLRLQLFPLL